VALARLETERLLLRPHRAGDLADMQRYATRPEFYRFLPIPAQTPETVREFLERELSEALRLRVGRYVFAIEAKTTGAVAGGVRLELQPTGHDGADIGYALDAERQGRGYAAEAVRRVLDHGFGVLRLHRIWATPDVGNVRSWRLLERLGLRREGLMRQEMLVRGAWRDTYLYAVLAEEWRGQRGV
jgi:RimJ/RimL family protein N-acetyltransferase